MSTEIPQHGSHPLGKPCESAASAGCVDVAGDGPEPVRHRLMYTRRNFLNPPVPFPHSWFVHGAVEAYRSAQEAYERTGIPVMVLEAPPGRVLTELYTVPPARKRVKR